MAFITVDEKFIKNESTKEVHRVLYIENSKFTNEKCNVDDIVKKVSIATDWSDSLYSVDNLCGHCFPKVGVDKT